MKKISLLLCALMIAGVTFACEGDKDKKCCKKGAKKECCSKKGDKKECHKKAKAEKAADATQ